jgi:hypothetical protein
MNVVMPYSWHMGALAFWRSQFRRRSWITTEAEVLSSIPADYLWGDNCQYLGVSHYYIQVRYSANAHEVLTDFRWHTPSWSEGDTLSLRYDPANPECNDRTGLWFVREVSLLVLLGVFILIAYMIHC